ncbi:hypothetical protein SDC9_156299 [bioreactor metagenome]|uniref:Uncharacterized protein n=1 Tax=bioreactor metagenome TaxID=1076179 RepID=A0A645F414_9ZZZZ
MPHGFRLKQVKLGIFPLKLSGGQPFKAFVQLHKALPADPVIIAPSFHAAETGNDLGVVGGDHQIFDLPLVDIICHSMEIDGEKIREEVFKVFGFLLDGAQNLADLQIPHLKGLVIVDEAAVHQSEGDVSAGNGAEHCLLLHPFLGQEIFAFEQHIAVDQLNLVFLFQQVYPVAASVSSYLLQQINPVFCLAQRGGGYDFNLFDSRSSGDLNIFADNPAQGVDRAEGYLPAGKALLAKVNGIDGTVQDINGSFAALAYHQLTFAGTDINRCKSFNQGGFTSFVFI